MKVYLASPFFNDKECAVKAQVKAHLEQMGVVVIDPQGGSDPTSWEQHNSEWGSKIFQKDLARIHEADRVVAIDWGLYGDCGTAWEVGFAYALDKPIIIVSPDEKLNTQHSLMVVNGCRNFISLTRFLSLDSFGKCENLDYFLAGVEQK